MVSSCNFISIFTLILLIKPILSLQSYDKTNCTSIQQVPGSNYLCNPQKDSCDTYIVYRAQDKYQTLSSIARLFSTSPASLLSANKMFDKNSSELQPSQEILVPVKCSCPDRFSHADIFFNASRFNSLYKVACEVLEGLVKEQILFEENPGFNGDDSERSLLQVPIRCACPDESDKGNGTKFLVTYPVVQNDHVDFIAHKFGVPEVSIWYTNGLSTFDTIFPQTTLLIPTKNKPVLNTVLRNSPAPSPKSVLLDILPGKKESNKLTAAEIFGWVLLGIFVLMVLACGFLVFIRRRKNPSNFKPLSIESSKLSKFSINLLDGMSKLKHSLISFSLEELKIATENFSEASVIGTAVYKGKIGASHLAIEQMNTEESARHVIGILTKINHLNVVKLVGCCYGPMPYLVYEFANHGSLRDCLSSTKMAKQLNWAARMQIAFDLAVGLHYIHHCTNPAYVHRNINSRNVLITIDMRAKISGFQLAKALSWSEEKGELNWNESVIVGRKGYLAPEYLTKGKASSKIDVYAFGVILLELLSAKRGTSDGKVLKEFTCFLDEEALRDSNGCLENFKRFMDPALDGDYPLGDAVCLAMLAMGCLEEDPLHRPTMNDALKALSRFF